MTRTASAYQHLCSPCLPWTHSKNIFSSSLEIQCCHVNEFCPMKYMWKCQAPPPGLAYPNVPLDLRSIVDSCLNQSLLGCCKTTDFQLQHSLQSVHSVTVGKSPPFSLFIYLLSNELISALNYFGVQLSQIWSVKATSSWIQCLFLYVVNSLLSNVTQAYFPPTLSQPWDLLFLFLENDN